MTETHTAPNVGSMYRRTTAEEAAAQTTKVSSREMMWDIFKKDVRLIDLPNGDTWVRIVNPYGRDWVLQFDYYEMSAGNKYAKVVSPSEYGDPNLFLTVQASLYKNPKTEPHMYRSKVNEQGFRFKEKRKAICIAARWEGQGLSPFGVLQVAVARRAWKKEMTPKPAWGDQLIKLPLLTMEDPTAGMDANPRPRWGAIFDVVDGRMIKVVVCNQGTMDVSADFIPSDQTMPLGEFRNDTFVPFPQYKDILETAPDIDQIRTRIGLEEQQELIRVFTPQHLYSYAKEAIDEFLSRGGPRKNGADKPVAAPAAPGEAPFTVPIPREEATVINDKEKVYLSMVQQLGPKFAQVGETAVRAMINRGLVHAENVSQMATLDVGTLSMLTK